MGLLFKKYDSDNISGPFQTAQGKSYYTVLFIEKEDEDGYSGQSKGHSKTFFEDTHNVQFHRAQKANDKDVNMKVIGSYCHVACKPYYVLDKEGNKMGQDLSKPVNVDTNPPRIGQKLTFFLMQDEDPLSAERAALKRLAKLNAFVDVDEDEDGADPETKAEVITGKSKRVAE